MGAAGDGEAMQTSQPDRLRADEVDLLASFLQNVFDWSELWSELGPGDRLRAEHHVTQELDELLEAGFVVYAGVRLQVLEGGVGSPIRWRLVVVVVFRSEASEIRDERIVLPISS